MKAPGMLEFCKEIRIAISGAKDTKITKTFSNYDDAMDFAATMYGYGFECDVKFVAESLLHGKENDGE